MPVVWGFYPSQIVIGESAVPCPRSLNPRTRPTDIPGEQPSEPSSIFVGLPCLISSPCPSFSHSSQLATPSSDTAGDVSVTPGASCATSAR